MTIDEVRELTIDELMDALVEAKEERFNLRFQVATNQLDNTARLKTVKKDIARIRTVLREREIAEAAAPDGAVAEDASSDAEEVGVPDGTPGDEADEKTTTRRRRSKESA